MRRLDVPLAGSVAVARYVVELLFRSRLVVLLFALGAASVGVSVVLTFLTPGTERRMFFDAAYLGLEALALLGPVLGATVLQILEFSQQTIWLVLVRPPSRPAYLWGRFCGLVVASLSVILAVGALLAVACLAGGAFPEPFFLPVLAAAALETVVVCAVASLFSLSTTSYLEGVVLMLGVVALGYLSSVLPALAASPDWAAFKPALWVIYWILPHLSDFAVRDFSAAPESWYLGLLGAYTAAYAGAVLLVAAVAFARREV